MESFAGASAGALSQAPILMYRASQTRQLPD